MTGDLQLLPRIVFAIVIAAWIGFVTVFLTRRSPPTTSDRKRDSGSIVGVVLQGLSYAIVWAAHRKYFTPIFPDNLPLEAAMSVLVIVIAISAVVITFSAVRILGKEWSVTARVLEGHKLATKGPYAFVRHPIYTGMFGMLLATGLAVGQWISVLVAIAVFFVGTIIRIRSEEKLLHEAFGSEFETYAQRVSAFIPGLY